MPFFYEKGIMISQKSINQIAYNIVGCAIEVHKTLGPGLLESIYQECFTHEMKLSGLSVQTEIRVPPKT